MCLCMSKISEVFIEDELIDSYLKYAMSVIIGRALPDVRDGLKPVHRRTLFAMKEMNNHFNRDYKKSARVVGDVIGKYHPHGEVAVYDSIVRLSQVFVQRYPLVDGQGNFGSIDGDSAAAMRYTEIRMSEFSEYLVNDLDFDTVDFIFNYDNSEQYPVVLPSMIPNLLVNGSCGIAVGMATNIPPHNLSEVINACLAFIDNPCIDIDGLMKYILGPDFPTYATINGTDGIINAYKTGKGKINIKAKTFIEKKNDKTFIIIKELPYQVNKAVLIERISFLVKEKKIDGIALVRDESDKDGLRVLIELTKYKNPCIVLNNLFALTKMESVFSINMVALVDNVPTLLSLKNIIKHFVDHRKEVVFRKTSFKLSKLERRIHILEGLLVALLNLDDIISIITTSKNVTSLKKRFSEISWKNSNLSDLKLFINNDIKKFFNYVLSEKQIQAILDLKLGNFIRIERGNLVKEYSSILDCIFRYKTILNNTETLNLVVKDELLFIKKKFGDIRRTKIKFDLKEKKTKDFFFRKEVIITLSNFGYIKFQLLENYKLQHRNGRGKTSILMKFNDYVQNFLISNTYDELLCFSNFGRLYIMSLHDLSLSKRISMGIPVVNFLNLKYNEKITVILSTELHDKNKYIFMITKKGLIKKIALKSFKNKKQVGLTALKIAKGDFLVDVKIGTVLDDIILFTDSGRSIRFLNSDIRCMSRASRGVIGMKLNKDECLVSLVVLSKDNYVFISTKYGYGKRVKIDEYPIVRRGGRGVISMFVNNKSGKISKVEKIVEGDNLFLITIKGIMLKIKTSSVPFMGRRAKGVCLISLDKDDCLIDIKRSKK